MSWRTTYAGTPSSRTLEPPATPAARRRPHPHRPPASREPSGEGQPGRRRARDNPPASSSRRALRSARRAEPSGGRLLRSPRAARMKGNGAPTEALLSDPRSVATRLRRPSGQRSEATASRRSPRRRRRGADGKPRRPRGALACGAHVAHRTELRERLAEVLGDLRMPAGARLCEGHNPVGARFGDEPGPLQQLLDAGRGRERRGEQFHAHAAT